jgi:hypothetical protein
MTPKEKADELCKKMLYQIEWNAQPSTVKGVTKQCALIAVDEILDDDVYDMSEDLFEKRILYWEEVKQEIQNL